MLSKRMIVALKHNSFRDGRTVRALQNRALIKNVYWDDYTEKWHYKYTHLGRELYRLLYRHCNSPQARDILS